MFFAVFFHVAPHGSATPFSTPFTANMKASSKVYALAGATIGGALKLYDGRVGGVPKEDVDHLPVWEVPARR